MIAENRRARAHIDIPLILMVAGLSLFGVIAVCVATYSIDSTAETLMAHIVESSSAMRQCFFLLLAPVIVSVIINIPYHILKRFTPAAYFGATALVLVTWVTNRAEGVKAWTDVIWGYTIQPSEFIKLAMILMLARDLSKEDRPLSTMKDFLHIVMRVGVPGVIILASGETGSLIVIVFFFAVMLFFSNVNMKLLLTLGAFAVLAVLALYGAMIALDIEDYRLSRILAFFNPELSPLDDAYQMRQSQIAIGSGGFSGIGTFVDGSMSQLNYVPADWTDFIYATIGEAWGFVGCFLLIAVYLVLIWRCCHICLNAPDLFGTLLASGITIMLALQVILNIAVVTSSMPPTGIALPFISYGGNSLLIFMASMGILLNISRHSAK